MKKTFWDLVDQYGRPLPVIPNTPRILSHRAGGLFVSRPSESPSIDPAATWYQRTPLGEAEYLLVRAQIEIPQQVFFDLFPASQASGVVEYRRVPGNRVRVTLAGDVTPLSRANLAEAISARRVVVIQSTSFMDDRRADLYELVPGRFPNDQGFTLLFPSKSGPTEAELGEVNPTAWDTEEEFFEAYKVLITRDFTG